MENNNNDLPWKSIKPNVFASSRPYSVANSKNATDKTN